MKHQETVIKNKKTDGMQISWIYIGRPGPWGNPFVLKHESQRDEILIQYEKWLLKQIEIGSIKKEDVLNLKGETLVCWCHPKKCHGHVLKKYADLFYEEKYGKQLENNEDIKSVCNTRNNIQLSLF